MVYCVHPRTLDVVKETAPGVKPKISCSGDRRLSHRITRSLQSNGYSMKNLTPTLTRTEKGKPLP